MPGEDVLNRHTGAEGTIQGFSINPKKVFVHWHESGDTTLTHVSDIQLVSRYRFEPTQEREAHEKMQPVGTQNVGPKPKGYRPMAKGRKGKVGVSG